MTTIDYTREEAAIDLERRIGAARNRHERLHRSGSKEEAREAHAELGRLLMQLPAEEREARQSLSGRD